MNTVDNPAAAAAAEDQRIGAFENFDPFNVIETAIILHIVAHAIEEKVGRRVLAAQGDLIAIALALPDSYARDIMKDISERIMRLILQLFAGNNVNSLGDIQQRRVGFCRCDRIGRDITFAGTGYDYRAAVVVKRGVVGHNGTG